MGPLELKMEKEVYSVTYDPSLGAIFEDYDIDAEVMAENISFTYGHAHMMSVLRAIALEKGEDEFVKEVQSANVGQGEDKFTPNCPLEVALLVHSYEPSLRRVAAASRHLHRLSAAILSRDKEFYIKETLGRNLTPGVAGALGKLVEDEDERIRILAFRHPFLIEKYQEAVFSRYKPEKFALAGNNNATESILRRLHSENDQDYDLEMCKVANLPLDIQWEFAKSSNDSFKRALLTREILDGDIAMHLAMDPSDSVMREAARNADRFEGRVAQYLFTNRKTVHSILATVSSDVFLLEEIAKSKEPSVRINVAKNYYTPIRLVRRLGSDENAEVANTAIRFLKTRSPSIV